TPRSHARPRLVAEPGITMGPRSRSRKQPKATPDHQVSCFAPGRIYVVRHPCAAPDPFALRLRGPTRRRPMDRAGPSAPKTGDYVDWDAWLFHGSRPQTPVDPYRPRTRRSRSARVP